MPLLFFLCNKQKDSKIIMAFLHHLDMILCQQNHIKHGRKQKSVTFTVVAVSKSYLTGHREKGTSDIDTLVASYKITA